jgi:hypothetical protein
MRFFPVVTVHHLGAFFAASCRKKPGFAGLSNCRFAAITSGVLPEAKLHTGYKPCIQAWKQA